PARPGHWSWANISCFSCSLLSVQGIVAGFDHRQKLTVQQALGSGCLLGGRSVGQAINEVVHNGHHVQSLYKMLVQRFLWGEGSKLCLPPNQQVAVVV